MVVSELVLGHGLKRFSLHFSFPVAPDSTKGTEGEYLVFGGTVVEWSSVELADGY